jgi:uncharacterized damage-inducible protein DinB
MPSTILISLFGAKSWANIKLFEVLTESVLQVSPEHRRSMVQTLNHVHVVDRIFRAHLLGERHPYTATSTSATPDLSSLRLEVAATDLWFEGYVATVERSALEEVIAFQFTDGDRGQMTREEMLHHVITHGAWHRGEVGQILESNSISSPPDSFTKFLHATQPSRRLA